jgi:hypothetical protein
LGRDHESGGAKRAQRSHARIITVIFSTLNLQGVFS